MIFHLPATEPINIGIITDTHFLSNKLMDGKYAIQNVVDKSGRNFIASPEILDQVLDEYARNKIDVLLIPGDLTKDGEKESHLEFREKLEPLHKQGVKIFVIPGNHDINMPNSMGYQGNQTFKTGNITPEDFANIYKDFGYANAISRDESSLSYVAELSENTWLLAIDAAKYEEYKDRQITSGRIKQPTENWIKKILISAKDKKKQVIAMMHWGVAEHLPMQGTFFSNYLVENYKYYASLLADNGVKIIFTGHFHSNDISKYISDAGNSIYDIETGTLSSYPFSYRYAQLHRDSISIKTKNITSVTCCPELVNTSKEAMKRIASTMAKPMLKNKKLNIPDQYIDSLSEIAGELFLLHLAGDEKLDDAMKERLIAMFKTMGFDIDENFDFLNLDFPPSDNNLTIYF